MKRKIVASVIFSHLLALCIAVIIYFSISPAKYIIIGLMVGAVRIVESLITTYTDDDLPIPEEMDAHLFRYSWAIGLAIGALVSIPLWPIALPGMVVQLALPASWYATKESK